MQNILVTIRGDCNMLQTILDIVKEHGGIPVESKDIKIGSRSRLRDLQRYRKLVDQKHPMVNGFCYGYKCNYTIGNCSPRAIIYWFGEIVLDGTKYVQKENAVWNYEHYNAELSTTAITANTYYR